MTRSLLCMLPLKILPLSFLFMLHGCGLPPSNSDLVDYIEETKRRPSGQIEPLPVFKPYETFTYSAMRIRSPFEPPVVVQIQSANNGSTQSLIKPDLNRPKEVLEGFNFNELAMVGSIKKAGVLWGLIDADGVIHRVRNGSYIGKNHGQIIALSEIKIDVMEIIEDGAGGWLQRPRTLKLSQYLNE